MNDSGTPARWVRVTVMTHRGARRDTNEDAAVVGALTLNDGVETPDPVTVTLPVRHTVVVAVADGLGGHAAGEVASGHATRRLAQLGPELTGEDAITEALATVNNELYELAERNPAYRGTGTTVAGLVLTGEDTWWFNVGDSRAYADEGGYLGQHSVDDSPLVPENEPGAAAPSSTVVVQTLGGMQTHAPITPHVGAAADARLWLLCSDGLSDLVGVAEMERVLAEESSDERVVKALWAQAMNASGRDNITVALVRHPNEPEGTGDDG